MSTYYGRGDALAPSDMDKLQIANGGPFKYTNNNGQQVEVMAKHTRHKRPPKKGEWYLSGALPRAYRAQNDLQTSYYIMQLVCVVKREMWKEV